MLSIGQSPRWDLAEPFRRQMPNVEFVEAGALDLLALKDLPPVAGHTFPLSTRLRSGQQVVLDEAWLFPHLQGTLDHLEEGDVQATVLLCAGTFRVLQGRRPLIKPFSLACAQLKALGLAHIGILSPFVDQLEPSRERWSAAGFQISARSAPLAMADPRLSEVLDCWSRAEPQLDCIVLDYVGHSQSAVAALRSRVPTPVLDLGDLCRQTLAALIGADVPALSERV